MSSRSLANRSYKDKLIVNRLQSRLIVSDNIVPKLPNYLFSVVIKNANFVAITNEFGNLTFNKKDVESVIKFTDRPLRQSENISISKFLSYFSPSVVPDGVLTNDKEQRTYKIILESKVEDSNVLFKLELLEGENHLNFEDINGRMNLFVNSTLESDYVDTGEDDGGDSGGGDSGDVVVFTDGDTTVYYAFPNNNPAFPDYVGTLLIPKDSKSNIGEPIFKLWDTVENAKSNNPPNIVNNLEFVLYEDFSSIDPDILAKATLPGIDNPSLQKRTYLLQVTGEFGSVLTFINMETLRLWYYVIDIGFLDSSIVLVSLDGFDAVRPPDLPIADYVKTIYKNETGDDLYNEGTFVTSKNILYFTHLSNATENSSTIVENEGIYTLDLNDDNAIPQRLNLDNSLNARWNGLELISEDNNKVTFFAAKWIAPGGLYIIEHEGQNTKITDFATKVNGNDMGEVNDVSLAYSNVLGALGAFFTDSELNKVYYKSNNLDTIIFADLGESSPNGIATVIDSNNNVTGLYVSLGNRGRVVYYSITWNEDTPVAGPKEEPSWGRLTSTGFGGDGLLYIDNFVVDNTSFGKVLISAQNKQYMGVMIYIFDINERLFIDVPFDALNLTIYENYLIVPTVKSIEKIDLTLVMNRSLLLKPNSMLNLGANLKPKIVIQGLTGARNMIVNKYNDLLVIVPGSGLLLYRINWNSDEILFGDEGILIINDSELNHAVASRYINNKLYIFVSTENEVHAYEYDDSSETNAIKSLTSKIIIINEINAGTETTLERGGGNHTTRELCFDQDGHLYIQVGSADNIDVNDKRSMVRRCSNSLLIQLLTSNQTLLYSQLDQWAIGLRNAVGLSCTPDNKIACVNMGMDELTAPEGVIDPKLQNGEPFNDYHPTDSFYILDNNRINKKYGYPYTWISGRPLIQNGTEIPANSNFAERRKLGANEQENNPYNDNKVRSEPFIQGCDVPLTAHVAPIAITYNNDDGNGKVNYDGKCDQRIVKTKSIIGNFAIITEKGSWNRTEPAGNKVVTLIDNEIEDFYYNSTFSSGSTESFSTNSRYTFRPTGLVIDIEGRILVGTQPSRGYQHGTIIAIIN